MAGQGQAPAMTAPFPNPPPYYKYFTKDNLRKLRSAQKTAPQVNGDAPTSTTTTLPGDLRYLVPPEPPADGKYRSFGGQYDLSQPDITLEAAGITQIYPSTPASTDPTPKLIALARAILLNYLELVGIMSNNPEEAGEKIEDLQTLFYNAHDLINQYRPHQARESLIMMMQEQVDRAKEEVAMVEEESRKLDQLLKSMEEAGEAQSMELQKTATASGTTLPNGELADATRRQLHMAMWDALDKELG